MALFSEAYITAIAAVASFDIVSTRTDDDSIDCTISSRTEGRPRIEVQLKATSQVEDSRDRSPNFPFALSRKNYDDLRIPIAQLVVPRLLVILHMPASASSWLAHGNREMLLRHSSYFFNLCGMPDIATDTTTMRVPWENEFTSTSLETLMQHVAVNKALPNA